MSKNDFVCQHLADMTGVEVERAISTEMTGLGVALVCGLTTGKHDSSFFFEHFQLQFTSTIFIRVIKIYVIIC